MEIFPNLEIGIFNGWLLVAILYLAFGILLMIFPRQVVARLYDRPPRRGGELVRRILGVLLVLAWLLLTILTPLRKDDTVLAVGLVLYLAGLTGFVMALFNFARTPLDRPVTSGLYRISRHPQQFMLSVSFLGVSIAMGSWIALALMMIAVIGGHTKMVAEERVCLEKYGDSYREYMEQVPRYFLFF